jgi:hypothetical protein
MSDARRWSAGLSTSLVLIVIWGCGDDPPAVTSSKTQATVKGTVTVKGKLASSGSVIFDGANFERKDVGPVTAKIGPDGGYSLQAYVGENRVTVSGKELIDQAPEIQFERLSFDVQGGDNTYNIDLPKKK